MGGPGSGRPPNPLRLFAKQQLGNYNKEEAIVLPDYSGVPHHGKTKDAFAAIDHEHDSRYLKLDASNDPVTGDLSLTSATTTALTVGDVLTVDTTNGRVGVNGAPSFPFHLQSKTGINPNLVFERQPTLPSSFLFREGGTNKARLRLQSDANSTALQLVNHTEDADIELQINDGGANKTITWDASADKLKHSAGIFNFDNDQLRTTGDLVILADTSGVLWGAAGDADIVYDGTDLVLDPARVGTGAFHINPTAEGTAFKVTHTGDTETGAEITANSLTTGTALKIVSNSALMTSGRVLDFSQDNLIISAAKTNEFARILVDRVHVGGGTISDDFDAMLIQRESTTYGGAPPTLNAAGSILKLNHNALQGGGTLNDTVIGLEISMDTTGSGEAISITTDSRGIEMGAGKDCLLIYDGTDLSINSSQAGSGTIKLNSSNNWTANASNTVTISNLAPAGVGTATIGKWLTVKDNSGTVYYIPAWT